MRPTEWGTWVLKGGYANQFRHPDGARFTEDVDLKIDADIESATDMVSTAARLDLGDPFSFELAAPPRTLVGPPGGGLRYVLTARLIGQELVRFKVDVSSQDAVVGNLEQHRSDPIVERLGLGRATFPVYPIAQQFVEKIHACRRPRDVENTRAKDLEPPTADDAHEALMTFLAPVLAGDRTQRWSPKTRTWSKAAARRGAGRPIVPARLEIPARADPVWGARVGQYQWAISHT